MTNHFEHYITRNIRTFYKRRLVSPIIYLLILIILWFAFPIGEIFSPIPLKNASQIQGVYEAKKEYVTVSFENLTFTGYTTSRFGSTNGYWYYGVKDDVCYIVLLTPFTCEEGNPTIKSLTTNCRIVDHKKLYQQFLTELSADLGWTVEGLSNQLPKAFYSEPDYNPFGNVLLFVIYFGSLIYTIISLIRYTVFVYYPHLSPVCQNLVVFGDPKKQLEEAEEELATLPQLATEDMFITEHYFIMTSPYGNAIVPIQEILWIYKYSTLHKLLWYHFSISYTLHITANKHMFIQCPKNIKSDIDGIIDYLSEANHDILVGFTEENRLKVEATQGKPFHIEKMAAILNKKI